MERDLRAAPVRSDEKLTYFLKIYISTMLGGYKFSDPDNNLEITWGFHIL